jgi:hypothetical protein
MSPPEKETGRRQRPATHHSTPTAIRIAKSAATDKGFVDRVLAGKARPVPRELDRTHYCCTRSCCGRWSA